MSTALYRRYRPETFDEVIGQEHVTEPLKAALKSGRVTHAYLFSGPRGCGKTTSARIFARCLNCAEGPTDTPCGTCDSCVELARGGSGSLDVVEIDAASHNGVDDARELRERAAFAPARDRYKIFILDEAHMVTPQGFNALLKLVEEPPDHVKFIFATTEPEKVIGTIRSRTHHYPFRLVPPGTLGDYLAELCAEENVTAAPGVLPMVVRAGAGSVRDSLSVLDQLIAGAPAGEITYDVAAALLGYTSASLLDDSVEALAGRDGAALFQVVDRMVQSGQDPRRFVEDLLQRLRDLVIIAIAGESGEAALGQIPEDQLDRMRGQAQRLGAAATSRAADLTHEALTEMSGATSPRLQVELLCARLVLPAEQAVVAPPTTPAVARGNASSAAPAAKAAPAGNATPVRAAAPISTAAPAQPGADRASATARAAAAALRDVDEPSPVVDEPAPPVDESAPAPAAAPVPAAAEPSSAGPDSTLVRRRWGEVLETLGRIRRASWALVSQNAAVGELSGGTLTLVFDTPGRVTAFQNSGHDANVALALKETLGLDVQVRGVSGEEGGPGQDTPPADDPEDGLAGPEPADYPETSTPAVVDPRRDEPSVEPDFAPEPPPAAPEITADDLMAAVERARAKRTIQTEPESAPGGGTWVDDAPSQMNVSVEQEDAPSPDDADAEDSGMVGIAVLKSVLGATVVGEDGR